MNILSMNYKLKHFLMGFLFDGQFPILKEKNLVYQSIKSMYQVSSSELRGRSKYVNIKKKCLG